jgi:nucleotide-binding universal stress UspA family protein
MLDIHTILVPADFSGCSEDAFRLGGALARDYRARLVVLHVPAPPPFVTYGELERALQRPDGYRAELESRLRQVYQTEAPLGVEYRVEEGDPAGEIVRAAQEVGCDLIVMGTHGRAGLDHLLTGSMAEQVIQTAPCPVMTVKLPRAQAGRVAESVPRAAAQALEV